MKKYFKYIPDALSFDDSKLYKKLKREIPWSNEVVRMRGKTFKLTRKTYSEGDDDMEYHYAGTVKKANEWTPTILKIKEEVENITGDTYNFVLCNYYRDGNVKIGWHSDSERDLDPNSSIASVSLGALRKFKIRSKNDHTNVKTMILESGSLLIMKAGCQKMYQHCVPPMSGVDEPRINLTFRKVG